MAQGYNPNRDGNGRFTTGGRTAIVPPYVDVPVSKEPCSPAMPTVEQQEMPFNDTVFHATVAAFEAEMRKKETHTDTDLSELTLPDVSEDTSIPTVIADGKLPLFMTAREIRSTHQGDSGGRHTSVNSGFFTDEVTDEERVRSWMWGDAGLETDKELYQRKLMEATPGLRTALKEDDYLVEYPIGLVVPVGNENYEVEERLHGTAEDTRPPITQGNHRFAVMLNDAPDMLMPVWFVEDLDDSYLAPEDEDYYDSERYRRIIDEEFLP